VYDGRTGCVRCDSDRLRFRFFFGVGSVHGCEEGACCDEEGCEVHVGGMCSLIDESVDGSVDESMRMKVLIEDEDKKMRGVGIKCGLYTGRDEEVFETARVQLVAQYWYNPHSVSALGGPLNRRI
jgi:hypothetical protein